MNSHATIKRVSEILLQDRDPTWVGDEVAARDEYDAYAVEIARMRARDV